MAALREYYRMKQIISTDAEPCAPGNRQVAMRFIEKARADGRDSLTEIEAKKVFSAYGLPIAKTELARDRR